MKTPTSTPTRSRARARAQAPAPDRLVSGAERELAQLAQTVIAARASAQALAEQCDAALIALTTMQLREQQRTATAVTERALRLERNPIPRTFGAATAASTTEKTR